MISNNLINSVLCCINPRVPLTPTHYTCGKNLALFSSFAQIENCLTCFTGKCKCLTSSFKCRDSKKE